MAMTTRSSMRVKARDRLISSEREAMLTHCMDYNSAPKTRTVTSGDVFRCPSDFYEPEPDDPIQVETWFDREGLSYEYPSTVLAGKTRPELLDRRGSGEIWVVFDFGNFHGSPAENGSRNFAYLDGHVDAVIVPED